MNAIQVGGIITIQEGFEVWATTDQKGTQSVSLRGHRQVIIKQIVTGAIQVEDFMHGPVWINTFELNKLATKDVIKERTRV